MRKRWKVVLFLMILITWLWLLNFMNGLGQLNHASAVERCEGLKVWYDQYNEQYFQNKLPHDTVIDFSEHGPYMATTSTSDGVHFRIAFNEKYAVAARYDHVTLLHEMCHIATPGEEENEGHGPRWRTCMLVVEAEGAFRAALIDGYEGN